jgi:coenzyme F420-0:L-glutamate ligase/coenzyme F420-1:gamma-L-glutamate ligase
MRLYAVKTRVIKIGDDLVEVILQSLREQNLQLEDNDILAVTSKIIAYAEGRVVKLSDFKPSKRAKELTTILFATRIRRINFTRSRQIYGGVEKAVLTLKNGVLTANAGIDNKNAPSDYAVLWPNNPQKWVKQIREEVRQSGHCIRPQKCQRQSSVEKKSQRKIQLCRRRTWITCLCMGLRLCRLMEP